MVVIKTEFTDAELKDCVCVTPQSFSAIKNWSECEVSGLKYYVDKAVSLGATKKKTTRKKKD
jgi:hypothetical protein